MRGLVSESLLWFQSIAAKAKFSTTPNSKKVSPKMRHSRTIGKPEIAILSNRKYLHVYRYPRKYGRRHQNSNGKPGVFDHGELEETVPRHLRRRPTTNVVTIVLSDIDLFIKVPKFLRSVNVLVDFWPRFTTRAQKRQFHSYNSATPISCKSGIFLQSEYDIGTSHYCQWRKYKFGEPGTLLKL